MSDSTHGIVKDWGFIFYNEAIFVTLWEVWWRQVSTGIQQLSTFGNTEITVQALWEECRHYLAHLLEQKLLGLLRITDFHQKWNHCSLGAKMLSSRKNNNWIDSFLIQPAYLRCHGMICRVLCRHESHRFCPQRTHFLVGKADKETHD